MTIPGAVVEEVRRAADEPRQREAAGAVPLVEDGPVLLDEGPKGLVVSELLEIQEPSTAEDDSDPSD